MSRPKTISDDEVLKVARAVFRNRGHTATTREIADAAGISEAILYQRFGSKDDLFFAAMRPTGPDIEELLGPEEPPEDARKYLRLTVAKVARYFAKIIPEALHVTTHPSFDPSVFTRGPIPSVILRHGLATRLQSLANRKRIAVSSAQAAARLLVSLAHDWALGQALMHANSPRRDKELQELVAVIWEGLRPQR